MSGQMAGSPDGDAGHVPEAAGRQPEQGGVLEGGVGGQVHQRGGREVRDVGDHGDQVVVAAGGQLHHVGAQRADRRADGGEGHRVGVGRRGEHPGGPLEHLGVRSLDALLFGAGHRVAADEVRMVQLGDDGALDAGHVGDDPSPFQGGRSHVDHPASRGGDKGDQGRRVGADLVDGTELKGPGLSGRIEIPARDPPAPPPQAQPDRAPDQARADDLGPRRGPTSFHRQLPRGAVERSTVATVGKIRRAGAPVQAPPRRARAPAPRSGSAPAIHRAPGPSAAAGRCGCAPAAAPDGPRRRTCGGPVGCDLRGG